jgi:hypothetical protein
MMAMTMATAGWSAWWLAAALARWFPDAAPPPMAVQVFSSTFAAFGIALALFTMRASRAWILISCVPLAANASLLLLPLVWPDAPGTAAP